MAPQRHDPRQIGGYGSDVTGASARSPADERERVHRLAELPDLEVQVWARRVAGAPDVPDDLAPLDLVTDLHAELALVAVEGADAVAVVDDRAVAVAALLAGDEHD